MRRDVITVPEGADVWDLARLFSERRITGAPVLDRDGRLVGVVSQTDLVRHFKDAAFPARGLLDFYSEPGPDGEEPFARRATARDLMNPVVIRAGEDTPVQALSRLMTRRRVHRVIITKGGKVVGIVTTMDLLRFL